MKLSVVIPTLIAALTTPSTRAALGTAAPDVVVAYGGSSDGMTEVARQP